MASEGGFVWVGVVNVCNDVFDGLPVHGIVNFDKCVGVGCRSSSKAFPVLAVAGKLGGLATESVNNLLYAPMLFLTPLRFFALPSGMVGNRFNGSVWVGDPFAYVDE